MKKKHPGYSPVNRVPRLAWMNFSFLLHKKFHPSFAGVNMSRGIVLSLVQFHFSYSSAIIILNSAFILGLLASKSNPIKPFVICKLRCNLS